VDREEKRKKAGTHRDVGTGIHTQKDRIIKLIMKASNDGHNRLRLGRWKEGSLLHLRSEREREIGRIEESLLFQLSKKIVFVVFEQNGKNRKRKTGEKEFC
jgi:hypothetical protein